jgi:hypothetical protein
MGEYTAPIKDMRFVLNNIVDMDALSKLETFAHAERPVTPE